MKHFQISLLLIAFGSILTGQDFDWFEYEKNPGAGLEIYHVTKENYLIGNIRHPQKYVYSLDNGASWEELCADIRFNWGVFNEDERGLFFTDFQSVYQLDLESGTCNQIYTQQFGNGVSHYSYREDETFWVAFSGLVRLDEFDVPIDTLEFEGRRNIRLHYQVGHPTYLTYQIDYQGPFFIHTIADDFSTISPQIQIPESVEYKYHYDQGRMYTSNGYSDDGGMTWISYNLPVAETEILNVSFQGSEIYFITNDGLYYSDDEGVSFQQQGHDYELLGAISLHAGNDYVNVSTRNCDQNIVASSENSGQDWTDLDAGLGLPFVNNIAANTRDEIVVSACGLQHWTPGNTQWNNADPDRYFSFINQIEALPNNDFFYATYEGFCLSSNGGLDWECEDAFIVEFVTGIKQKENSLFIGNFDQTYMSFNNAQDFELHTHDFWLESYFDFFSSQKAIFYSYDEKLGLYDYQTQEIIDLNRTLDDSFQSLATTWSGTTVYYLEYTDDSQEQLQLLTSQDEGRTFIESILDFPLEGSNFKLVTDHNDNIFIYSTQQVLISQDQGSTWLDITPSTDHLIKITELYVSFDNYIFLSTSGTGVLRSECEINVVVNMDCFSPLTDNDGDQYFNNEDCDDNNPNVNPGAVEVAYNGLDDDCNPATFDDDIDQDGYLLTDDCDDNKPDVNPGAVEVAYNGLDDDCDPATLDDDLDQDGFPLADDCDDNNASINPDAEDIPNNMIDEDCDGVFLMTSIEELSDFKITIFPNPVSDQLEIKLSDDIDYSLRLYTPDGALIYSGKNDARLDMQDLNSGLYLLEVINQKRGEVKVLRVVKI